MLLIGFLLGFLGYLPLGNINLSVVQLSLSGSRVRLNAFILFAAIMEFTYCYLSLRGLDFLLKQPSLINTLTWSSVVIFLLIGIVSLLHQPGADQNSEALYGFKKGIVVAILNPLQIPFWLVWGVYVFQHGWVHKNSLSISIFSVSCAIGTMGVLWLYAMAGKALIQRMNINQLYLNRFIGVLFIAMAIYQAFRALFI